MASKTKTCSGSDIVMDRLVSQAETEFNKDRRSTPRFPFFRPVSIQLDGKCFSAFTREVSSTSIGLLHNMDLPLTEILIMVPGQQHVLIASVERCESCGEGWYISGCSIVRHDA
jgi:hypothetical protein